MRKRNVCRIGMAITVALCSLPFLNTAVGFTAPHSQSPQELRKLEQQLSQLQQRLQERLAQVREGKLLILDAADGNISFSFPISVQEWEAEMAATVRSSQTTAQRAAELRRSALEQTKINAQTVETNLRTVESRLVAARRTLGGTVVERPIQGSRLQGTWDGGSDWGTVTLSGGPDAYIGTYTVGKGQIRLRRNRDGTYTGDWINSTDSRRGSIELSLNPNEDLAGKWSSSDGRYTDRAITWRRAGSPPPENIVGEWQGANWGTVTLSGGPDAYFGTYTDGNGQISLRRNRDGAYTGDWINSTDSRRGSIELSLAPNGDMVGKWSSSDGRYTDRPITWKRTGSPPPSPPAGNIGGEWDGGADWGAVVIGGGPDSYFGTYTNGKGQITLRPNRSGMYAGDWINSTDSRRGSIELSLAPNGDIVGKWNSSDGRYTDRPITWKRPNFATPPPRPTSGGEGPPTATTVGALRTSFEECKARVSAALAAERYNIVSEFGNGWIAAVGGTSASVGCVRGSGETVIFIVTSGADAGGARDRLVRQLFR